MEKVASVNGQTGDFERFYASKHDGLYVDRVDGDADLGSLVLFLRFTNFTSEMQNIYCIKYEMSGKDDINTCHSQALILRDIGEYVLYCTAREEMLGHHDIHRSIQRPLSREG